MKRYKALMLALAAFASILLLTAAAAVLLGSGGWQGAKDAAYPYTWKETTDGALALRLDMGARSDAAWSVADGSGMTSVSFGDTRRRYIRFRPRHAELKPAETKNSKLYVQLQPVQFT